MPRVHSRCCLIIMNDVLTLLNRQGWEKNTEGYPKAVMLADICKVPPVTSAPQRLHDFIKQRNITSIVSFGDSQGHKSYNAFIDIFLHASFKCKQVKREIRGFDIQLDYYTKYSGVLSNATITRTCASCTSTLHLCSDTHGRVVSVEYLSRTITSTQPMLFNHRFCQLSKTDHTLCLNTIQPEYAFKYYLNRPRTYPQLLLIFSAFTHDNKLPLEKVCDNMKHLLNVMTSYVPHQSDVIWYDSPPFYADKVFHWAHQ